MESDRGMCSLVYCILGTDSSITSADILEVHLGDRSYVDRVENTPVCAGKRLMVLNL